MAVTIKDISARCGLSISTVSKAFNNYSDISKETRELVQRTARELGYYPNALARALKTSRSFNLGILYNDASPSGLTHDFFSAVLDAFKKESEKRGYDLTFLNHHMAHGDMTYLEHCHYRNVDGVVIVCADFSDPEVQELGRSSIPSVSVDYEFPGRSAVMSENVDGMEQLVSYAVKKGHERIALIYGTPSEVTERRRAGYRKGMARAGLTVPDEYVVASSYDDPAASYHKVMKLLDLPKPPTCILLPDDNCCLGAMQAAEKRGLRVPQDLSLAGFDGIQLGKLMTPRLTTILQDTRQLGARAAELLIESIEEGSSPGQVVNVPVKLIHGESIGPVKKEA